MREGDQNSKFFHRVASGRTKRNTIEKVEDDMGWYIRKRRTFRRCLWATF